MGIRTSVHTEKCLTRENDRSYIVCTQTMSFRLTMFRVLRTCKVNTSSDIMKVMNKLTFFMFVYIRRKGTFYHQASFDWEQHSSQWQQSPGGTLGLFGWGCAAGTLEPFPIPELVQENFATLY